jgi:competence protein ComEA
MIGLDKKQIIIGGVIIAVIVGIIGYYFYTNLQTNEEEIIEIEQENKIEEKQQQEEIEEEQIIVHIAGEVKKPGIIKTKEGARIADIIEKAGGLNEQADITDINLAYPVEDGQKITIPKKGEETNEYITEASTSNSEDNKETTTENKKININKATQEELQTLQGIRRSNSTKNN